MDKSAETQAEKRLSYSIRCVTICKWIIFGLWNILRILFYVVLNVKTNRFLSKKENACLNYQAGVVSLNIIFEGLQSFQDHKDRVLPKLQLLLQFYHQSRIRKTRHNRISPFLSVESVLLWYQDTRNNQTGCV